MTSYLVTGASGAFGQAFVRRLLRTDDARRIVVFSRGEAKQAEMRARFHDPEDRIRWCIGDVRDSDRVMDACRGVDVVVHAAALKRIETCEADPNEATATNVFGTQNVARACIERGVKRAVFLSTDKAAAPNTHYGATKLAAERLWVASNVYAGALPTRFAATRYGNVLGSTGSVALHWREQKARHEPFTLTDGRCTRFWMRIEDAVDLVLLALHNMVGGEVFIPRLGASSVLDLARAVDPHWPVRETKLRPGEKLHETLVTEDEARRTHDHGTHYTIEPEERLWEVAPPVSAPRVREGFTYRSDTARRLSVEELRGMLGYEVGRLAA